jgi:hypothetical protein
MLFYLGLGAWVNGGPGKTRRRFTQRPRLWPQITQMVADGEEVSLERIRERHRLKRFQRRQKCKHWQSHRDENACFPEHQR